MNSFTNLDGSRPVLVTGGTGTLGRLVVERLLAEGHAVRVLSRGTLPALEGTEQATADLQTGEGVAAAVAGTGVVLHLAGSRKGDGEKTRTLVDVLAAGGERPHLVFVSVVGADRVPVTSAVDRAMFGYFGAKREAERVIEESDLPWTTLRASQFHDLILMTVTAMTKLPVAPVPAGVRFQPVEAAEVADRLVELAAGAPQGYVDDLAGPRIYPLKDLVRSYLAAAGKHRPLLGMPVIGGAGRAIKAGANLAPDHATGHRTWEAFLAERVGRRAPRIAGAAAPERPLAPDNRT